MDSMDESGKENRIFIKDLEIGISMKLGNECSDFQTRNKKSFIRVSQEANIKHTELFEEVMLSTLKTDILASVAF